MSKDLASSQSTIDSSDSNVTDLARNLHNCLALYAYFVSLRLPRIHNYCLVVNSV